MLEAGRIQVQPFSGEGHRPDGWATLFRPSLHLGWRVAPGRGRGFKFAPGLQTLGSEGVPTGAWSLSEARRAITIGDLL